MRVLLLVLAVRGRPRLSALCFRASLFAVIYPCRDSPWSSDLRASLFVRLSSLSSCVSLLGAGLCDVPGAPSVFA